MTSRPPAFEKLYQRHKADGLRIVAVNIDQGRGDGKVSRHVDAAEDEHGGSGAIQTMWPVWCRSSRINVNDLWIAATAASRGLPIVTQDDDFAPVEGMAGLMVLRV